MHRESLVIVTPALAAANNGNWQTAQRWARLLAPAYRVRLSAQWADGDEALMVALGRQIGMNDEECRVAGLAGLTMLFIWFGSAHVAGHGNENLLLLSPLCLFLLPGGWARLRGREPSARFRWLLRIVVAGAALAGFLKFLPFRPQENVEWVLLLLPLHWALLRRLDPPR